MSGLFFKSVTFFYVSINTIVVFVVTGKAIAHSQDARYFSLIKKAGARLTDPRQSCSAKVDFGAGAKAGFFF